MKGTYPEIICLREIHFRDYQHLFKQPRKNVFIWFMLSSENFYHIYRAPPHGRAPCKQPRETQAQPSALEDNWMWPMTPRLARYQPSSHGHLPFTWAGMVRPEKGHQYNSSNPRVPMRGHRANCSILDSTVCSYELSLLVGFFWYNHLHLSLNKYIN